MKLLFDTNVVVAALVQDHDDHAVAFPLLDDALNRTSLGYLSTHGLAEAYSVLTTLPIRPRIEPEGAKQALAVLEDGMSLVALEPNDYEKALNRVAHLGLAGGALYDALHAQAALKVGVDGILTFNSKHFTRLGEEIARLVRVP